MTTQIVTPVRVFILALVVGIGTALMLAWQTPLPPAEDASIVAAAPPPSAPSTQPAMALAAGAHQTTSDGITIIDIKEGEGLPVKDGDVVSVNYVGRLYYGGKEFDSSSDHGRPMDFSVSAGQVIKGMDEGIVGMKLGGKRQLMIPPYLAYGNLGAGNGLIPPGAALVFDLELVKIQEPPPSQGPQVPPG
jgi:peptidylprolyl isomerase